MHLFSFRLDIFIFFRMLRQIFLSCLVSFSAFFRPDEKKSAAFFSSGSSVFWDLFRFVGIIFPAFFLCRVRNFSVCFHNFFAFLELFWKKNPLFSLSVTQFRTCLSWQSGYFSSFFRGETEKFFHFVPVSLCFSWIFSKEKSAFFAFRYPVSDIFSLPSG